MIDSVGNNLGRRMSVKFVHDVFSMCIDCVQTDVYLVRYLLAGLAACHHFQHLDFPCCEGCRLARVFFFQFRGYFLRVSGELVVGEMLEYHERSGQFFRGDIGGDEVHFRIDTASQFLTSEDDDMFGEVFQLVGTDHPQACRHEEMKESLLPVL